MPIGNHRLVATFLERVTAVNRSFSRFGQSSLDPLLKELSNGAVRLDRKKIQEIVFSIPHASQQKYQDPLDYLARNLGIVVCGRPTDPGMVFKYFRACEYFFHGIATASSVSPGISMIKPPKLWAFHHAFDFTFKSTTGNLQSLRNVGTREHVKFRNRPTDPPFNEFMGDTPIEFFHGENLTGAHTGWGRDVHSTKPPSLICKQPLEVGELVADQWYQYTVDRGKTWENIPGAAYNLVKGVRKDKRGRYVFYFIKKNWELHNKKFFCFEVEYLIEPLVLRPLPGSKLPKFDTGSGEQNIKEYASAVIRPG